MSKRHSKKLKSVEIQKNKNHVTKRKQFFFNSFLIRFLLYLVLVLFQFYRGQSFWIFFNFFTGWCLKMAPRICNIRGLSSFLDLGGQVVHNAVRGPAAPSILPKSRWAIAHSAHPPLTPEYVTKKFTKEDMFAN